MAFAPYIITLGLAPKNPPVGMVLICKGWVFTVHNGPPDSDVPQLDEEECKKIMALAKTTREELLKRPQQVSWTGRSRIDPYRHAKKHRPAWDLETFCYPK